MATNFVQALEFIYSFIDYGSEPVDRYSADSFELSRIQDFMRHFGDPQLSYPSVHVAGTKGKGSVSAMVASVLKEAGYRTGLYTSPHLIRFNERIQLNGEPIADNRVVDIVEQLRPIAQEHPDITTYELTTALAFIYFREEKVDVAVFEVGLGGRLDATNIVNPTATAITSISLDHTQILGDTVAAIAAEKAGIIKPGVPVILASQRPEAENVLRRTAKRRKALVQLVGVDWTYHRLHQARDGQSFTVGKTGHPGEELWIPLLGEHQVENATVARALLTFLREAGLKLPAEALQQGFRNVRWPGRFQIVQDNPPVVLDASHNADSARRVRLTLEEIFPGSKVVIVFGASADKDIEGMMKELAPMCQRAILTQADHPRSAPVEMLEDIARGSCEVVESRTPIESAIELGLDYAHEGSVLLVTGSVFLVGEALPLWLKQDGGTGQPMTDRETP